MRVLCSHDLDDDARPAAQNLAALAAGLRRLGHEVEVHRSAGPARPERAGAGAGAGGPRVGRLAWALARNAPMARRDAEALRRFGPDVVLARPEPFGASMPWAAGRLGVPLVTYADAPVAGESGGSGLAGAVEGWALRRSRAAVAVSRAAAARLGRQPGAPPVHVVPHGVDPSRFAPVDRDRRRRLREALGLTAPHVLGFVGGFPPGRGTGLLRDLILATAHREDAQWLLVGDGPGRPALESAVAPHARVVSLGRRPAAEVGRLMALMDVAVAPQPAAGRAWNALKHEDHSDWSCPRRVLEYAAAGCAVVAGDGGDVPELLAFGTAGSLVRGPGLDPWVLALRDLLDDPARRLALGAAARDWVHGRFTWDHAAARVAAVLTSVLGARPAPRAWSHATGPHVRT